MRSYFGVGLHKSYTDVLINKQVDVIKHMPRAVNRIQMFPFDIDKSDIEDNPEQVIDNDPSESEEEDGEID